ncbi:hypothetical protein ABZV75_05405 [Streptomyces flaveolus]
MSGSPGLVADRADGADEAEGPTGPMSQGGPATGRQGLAVNGR